MTKKRKKEILIFLKEYKKNDSDKSLFYAWANLSIKLQNEFIVWCKKYMQVSHKECFGGWAFGWSKYHNQFVLWLQQKRKDLE